MRTRLKKEDYMSETSKQLEQELKNQIKQDKDRARAKRIIDTIPDDLKQTVLEELSRTVATK